MKFTEGEFRVTEPGQADGHYMIWADKTLVAVVHGDGHAEANAKLLAASKKMFETIKQANSDLDSGISPRFVSNYLRKAIKL